jgi:hypothetical protein
VSGTFVERDPGSLPYEDDQYIVGYEFSDQPVRAALRSLPGNLRIGDSVCLEIDAARPDHARVCGTQGGLDDSRQGLLVGGGLLAALAAVIAVASLLRHRREEDDLVGTALAAADPATAPVGSYAGTTLVLRPHPAARWTMAIVFPGCAALVALAMLDDPTYRYRQPQAAALLLVAALILMRCLRVAVRCTPHSVTVQGLLITRRIPTAQVTGVDIPVFDSYPVVHWREPSGRRHRIKLRWFGVDRSLYFEPVLERHLGQMRRLDAWLDAQNGTPEDPSDFAAMPSARSNLLNNGLQGP